MKKENMRSVSKNSSIVIKMGFWSAILSAIFSIGYVIAQVADLLGLSGPQGGPLGLTALMLPSFFGIFIHYLNG